MKLMRNYVVTSWSVTDVAYRLIERREVALWLVCCAVRATWRKNNYVWVVTDCRICCYVMCRHEETCDDYGFAIASSHLSQDNCACCIICCIAIQYCSSLHLIAFPEELCGLETCRHNPNMAAKLLQQMKLFFMLKIDHHQYSSIHMAVMNFPSYQYGVML
jgi:hypothetical protein